MEILQTNELALHKVALSTPKMDKQQYDALKADIDSKGQLDPVTLYRGKIVDGRHRWLILQDLGVPTIKTESVANNTTLTELQDLVVSKEMRRHETAGQLAIRAYRLSLEDGYTQASAAKSLGADRKKVGLVKKITTIYQRPDIIDGLFNGEKFDVGDSYKPFYTDSLNTIEKWLEQHGVIKTTKEVAGLEPRTELMPDEQLLVNKYVNTILDESVQVRKAVQDTLYARLMESV